MTANVQGWGRMPLAHVVAVLLRLLENKPELLGTQELWWNGYRKAIRDKLPTYGHIMTRSKRPGTVASWRYGRLRLLDQGVRPLHGTVYGGTVSWWRRITWLGVNVLEERHQQPVGFRIAFACTHFTPSAFSNRYGAKKRARIRRHWNEGAENLREWIEDMFATGYTHVAIALDANANARTLYDALGDRRAPGTQARTFLGRPLSIHSSKYAGKVDHVILVGRWRVHKSSALAVPHGDHPAFFVDAEPVR